MATRRLYHLTIKPAADATPVERLVRAGSRAQAVGHVARQTIACDVAQPDDVYRLATAKVAIEDAAESDEPASDPPAADSK